MCRARVKHANENVDKNGITRILRGISGLIRNANGDSCDGLPVSTFLNKYCILSGIQIEKKL
jgi:hypothetical protein